MLGLPDGVTACLFDLDGVLTDTASVHNTAWTKTFDAFLEDRDGAGFTPFDPDVDYPRYVDGKKREDGVRSFLASRDIELPDGSPDDEPGSASVYGIGNAKNARLLEVIDRDGVTVFEGSRRYLQAAKEAGLRIAVVSSSANTEQVLRVTGLDVYVEVRVDGVVARKEGLAGKPEPDTFLRAAGLLGVEAAQAAVFEDALVGVEAGRAGTFGHVVGVDRIGQAAALTQHGADVVVTDLDQLL